MNNFPNNPISPEAKASVTIQLAVDPAQAAAFKALGVEGIQRVLEQAIGASGTKVLNFTVWKDCPEQAPEAPVRPRVVCFVDDDGQGATIASDTPMDVAILRVAQTLGEDEGEFSVPAIGGFGPPVLVAGSIQPIGFQSAYVNQVFTAVGGSNDHAARDNAVDAPSAPGA